MVSELPFFEKESSERIKRFQELLGKEQVDGPIRLELRVLPARMYLEKNSGRGSNKH